jgi:putative FmdB family regulatory protein
MPTYEYQCKECSHRFEIWQKITDEPLTVCPACGGRIRRVLFPAGIVFKGSGFYKTDYSNGSGANGHSPESHGAEPAKETSATSGEDKSSSASSGANSSPGAKSGENTAATSTK